MNGIGTNRVALVTVYSSFVIALLFFPVCCVLSQRCSILYFLPYARRSIHLAWMYHIRHCPSVMSVRWILVSARIASYV